MRNAVVIRGGLLAHNTALNLIGQAVPLLAGFFTIPYVIRGLGNERFAVLSMAWVLLGYFSLFDLGLGRATTKFVAECLGRGEIEKLPGWVWSSLVFQLLYGVGGAAIVGALIPFVVGRLLKVPPSLIGETKTTFYILAASLPVVLANTAVRGVLEAAQRFDLVNYVRVPVTVSIFLLPAIALPFGLSLPGIVLLLVLARLGGAVGYLVFCIKIFPDLARRFLIDFKMLRSLLIYGGWVSVSNVVSPMLVYLDRFFIGSFISLAAVGYYTVPYEAVTRLSILPSSLVATLFPAFSSMGAPGANRTELAALYARSVKFLLLGMGPLMALVVVFASPLLKSWVGADFAGKSVVVLQILAVGMLINSLAFVPFSLLQGLGRPDLTAKFHLFELPIYVGLVWFLIVRMGIAGAALAWTMRVTLDAVLLFGASWRLGLVNSRSLRENGLLQSFEPLVALALLLLLTELNVSAILIRLFLSLVLVTLFALFSWHYLLDNRERIFLGSFAARIFPSLRLAK